MNYLKEIIKHRQIILTLALQKIKKQYSGTTFSYLWIIISPSLYVATFYIFFVTGLRFSGEINGVPFLLFILPGTIPWMFQSACIKNSSQVFISNSELINCMKFPVILLPVIEILSLLIVHWITMILVFGFFIAFDYPPTIHYINFFYYTLIMSMFYAGISFFLGTLTIFISDLKPLINSIMMPLFWITPIIWITTDEKVILLEKIFNPFYYMIHSYRTTLIDQQFFWEEPWYNLYFIFLIAIIYTAGFRMFKKLRSEFADMI